LPITHGFSNKNEGVKIGNYSWVMHNCSIGPGINIGSNVIVLPGSVLVKDIPNELVVYDTPTKRDAYPLIFFKKELDDTKLDKLIRDITISYLESLKKNNKSLNYTQRDSSVEILINNNKINIYFNSPSQSINKNENESNDKHLEANNNCFFYYKIDKEEMRTSEYFILDFTNIRCSSISPPDIFSNYNSFMFFNYGLKFIKD